MSRLLGTIAGLALSASLAVPGQCVTAMAPSRNTGGEHDCCQTGLRSTPPACCMGSMAVSAPAQISTKATAEPPVTSHPLFVQDEPCVGQAEKLAAFLGAPHLKVPARVLRV